MNCSSAFAKEGKGRSNGALRRKLGWVRGGSVFMAEMGSTTEASRSSRVFLPFTGPSGAETLHDYARNKTNCQWLGVGEGEGGETGMEWGRGRAGPRGSYHGPRPAEREGGLGATPGGGGAGHV